MFLAMNAGFVVDYVYLSGPRQGPPAVGTPDSGWQKTNKIWWTQSQERARCSVQVSRYSHDICLLRIFCGHTGI